MKLFKFLQSSFKVDDIVKVVRTVTQKELDLFSSLSGDHNPIHKQDQQNKPLVHGAFLNSIVAGVIGTKLPGPGTIVISQNFSFPSKCFADEPIDVTVELVDVRKIIKVKYKCSQNGNEVMEGEARLMLSKIKGS